MVILNINSRKTVLFPIFDESYLTSYESKKEERGSKHDAPAGWEMSGNYYYGFVFLRF